MAVIDRRFIRRPRKEHWCAYCSQPITGSHVAFFGMAEPGDKPYWLRAHVTCTEPVHIEGMRDAAAVEKFRALLEAT
jgi:hypothetical protein